MFVISTSYDSFILRELDSSWYVEPSTGGGVVEMGIMFPKYDYNKIMLWWIIDALSLARFGKFVKNALSSMHFVFCRCLSVFYFAFGKKSLCLIRHA